MTRISAGIRAYELCDKHLNKERIEVLRIPNAIKEGKAIIANIPKHYKLGTGHVRFFYNKLAYLHKRYNELTDEAIKRGFNITDFSDTFNDLPIKLYNDWIETDEARLITKDRVNTRLKTMKNIKYNKKNILVSELYIN